MKRQKISEVIGNINHKYIDEATVYAGAAKSIPKKTWHKWAMAAACFAIVLAIGSPLAGKLFSSRSHTDTVDSILLIEYNDAYWEIIDNPDSIEKYGVGKEITEDDIGNHIAYLQNEIPEDEGSNYIVTDKESNTELLEYAAAPFRAVRIFRNGDKYHYALFRNYLIKANESLPIQYAFDVYGLSKAEDITGITPVKSDNAWKANGEAITDSAVISGFYAEITKLTAHSFDEYHDAMFGDELDSNGGDVGNELYARAADDRRDIVIETKDGLRFAIYYYPSYSWIYATQTMSYYQMSPEISEWFSSNIK